MKKFQNSIIGILLIIVGTILGLNAFHITHINLFFEGWWTLFIIIPSLCGIFTERDKTASLIGLFIGVYLLLSCQGIISFHFLWKLFLPLVLIILGIQILFKNSFSKNNSSTKATNTFSNKKYNFDYQTYAGGNYDVSFGGMTLDLRKANFESETMINVSVLFAGVDLYLPEDVNLQIESSSFFGGVDRHQRTNKESNTKIVILKAHCVFGGINIR